MSRVDDSNNEKRAAEARLADRRNKERLQKDRTAESTAFDKAMARQSTDAKKTAPVKEAPEPVDGAEEVPLEAELDGQELETASAGDAQKTKPGKDRTRDALGKQQKTFGEKLEEKAKPPPRNQQASAGIPVAKAEARSGAIVKDARTSAQKSDEGKNPDSKTDDINRSVAGAGSSGRKQGPAARAGEEGGGSGSREQGKKDEKSTSFKVPMAALMAPPPLARPRDTGQASRLSAMTKEIIEKIVSRVLVGTNRQGESEFRIDLKSSTLKGLTIKVSGGRGGKIRAVFSGSDREVLAALKQSQSELKEALTAKGLSLEELVFEEA